MWYSILGVVLARPQALLCFHSHVPPQRLSPKPKQKLAQGSQARRAQHSWLWVFQKPWSPKKYHKKGQKMPKPPQRAET